MGMVFEASDLFLSHYVSNALVGRCPRIVVGSSRVGLSPAGGLDALISLVPHRKFLGLDQRIVRAGL